MNGGKEDRVDKVWIDGKMVRKYRKASILILEVRSDDRQKDEWMDIYADLPSVNASLQTSSL